ncbi:MAG: glycerophosphodiester phosphodiesterase [Acidobacteria bacterium]|nr:glycerophosphodiester phosphodiesterase [Acidobacteriota bacterium]
MFLIAHRGYSGRYPENTLLSFRKALEAGADFMELDVHLSRDGHVVVIHDATLNRTTDGKGKVAEKTLEELKPVSAGYPEKFGGQFEGERIPTLDEVLELLQGKAQLLVEIKSEAVTDQVEGGVEEKALAAVKARGMERDAAFLSFELRALERLKQLSPEVRTGALFGRRQGDDLPAIARKLGAEMLVCHYQLVLAQPDLVRGAHQRGLKVAVYTVDDLANLEKVSRTQPDGVATNYIREFLEYLQELKSP